MIPANKTGIGTPIHMSSLEKQQNAGTYFENLDGLRFICFLLVFLYHSFYTEYDHIKSSELYDFVASGLFGHGNLGVNAFFVLSGFLITYLLIEEKKLNGKIHLPRFWMRRTLRIWPLYYASVLIGFVLFPIAKNLLGETPNELANITYYVTFLGNFDKIATEPDASILAVLWSIAIEEQFYLIWPIILALLPVRKYWMAFASVIIASLIFRATHQSMRLHEYHTLSCIGDMAMGAFGAWLMTERPKALNMIKKLKRWHIAGVYAAFISVLLFRYELFYWNPLMITFERIFIAGIILLIILEQCYASHSLFKLSRFKGLSRLGTITYGLYCLHFIGILVTLKITTRLGLNQELWQVLILETIIALVLSILLATLSYRFFETPFLRLKKRFSFRA